VEAISQAATQPREQSVEAYLSEAQTGASVNVAGSVANADVSTALEGFSTANSQAQAVVAYNS
jgi:hypothetical protein